MLLESALELLEQGFSIIPVSRKKQALVKWRQYQDTPPTEKDVEYWCRSFQDANTAILTGKEVIVVDADSSAAIEWIETGKITRTPWRVRTGKGKHYYYLATGLHIPNSVGGSKIDIRGTGGYVVAPPSVHENGSVYEWEKDPSWPVSHFYDLPALNTDDLDAIAAYNGGQRSASLGNLAAVKGPVEEKPRAEGSRNATAASLIGKWIREGASKAEMWPELEAWNAENSPPLSAQELKTVFSSVCQTHEHRTGEAVADEPAAPAVTSDLVSWTLGEFDCLDIPEPEKWWRAGFLSRRGRFVLAGPPKSGKSAIFIKLAFAAACGGTFLGERFTRPLKVLWVNGELDISWLRERFAIARREFSESERSLIAQNFIGTNELSGVRIEKDAHWKKIVALVAKHSPDFVCFDPFVNFTAIDEKDNAILSDLLTGRISWLTSEFNVAVALLHHTTKARYEGSVFNNVRGGGAFRGWYTSAIALQEDKGIITASYESRYTKGDQAHGMTVCWESGEVRKTLIESKKRDNAGRPNLDPNLKNTLIEMIRAHGEMTAAELHQGASAITQASHDSVTRALNSLVDDGSIEKSGAKRWTMYRLLDE